MEDLLIPQVHALRRVAGLTLTRASEGFGMILGHEPRGIESRASKSRLPLR